MAIRYTELVEIYLHCMRDHNTGFNPAWEYFGRSEMQRFWLAFEYFHRRFLTKASVEMSDRALKIGSAAAFGAAGGAVAGPGGAAMGAATGAAIMAAETMAEDAVKGVASKIQRQWHLSKGREAMRPSLANVNLFYLIAKPEEFYAITGNGYYFWPGYERSRIPINKWLSRSWIPGDVSDTRSDLKGKIFFKPPKSGARINNSNFSYSYLLCDTDEELRKHFDLIWRASKFWPMLDYHFFNQGLYSKFEDWKTHNSAPGARISREAIQDLFFASRFYFLSRDFYLDHFFGHILPKYSIILSRTFLSDIETDSLQLDNFNIFGLFLQSLQKKISAQPAANIVNRVQITNQISIHLITACRSHLEDLPIEIKIMFQKCMREMFLEYQRLEIFEPEQIRSNQSSQIALANEKVRYLQKNEEEYDKTVAAPISERERKFKLRNILKQRESLLRGDLPLSTGLSRDEGERFEVELELVQESAATAAEAIIDLAHATDESSREELQQAAIRESAIAGVIGGIAITVQVVGALSSHAIESRLTPEQKEIWANIKNIYGSIRLIGGTANYICRAVTTHSIMTLALKENIVSSVINVFFVGPTLMNMLVAYAIQCGKNFLYQRRDKLCLMIVDQLVIKDDLHIQVPKQEPTLTKEPILSDKAGTQAPEIAAGNRDDISGSSRTSSKTMQPAEFKIITDMINASNCAVNALILANSAVEFKESNLVLPGAKTYRSHETDRYVLPATMDLFYTSDGSSAITPAMKTRIVFYGSGSMTGIDILSYAATVTYIYSQIIYDWTVRVGTSQIAAQDLEMSTIKFFEDLFKHAQTRGVNDTLRIAFGTTQREGVYNINICLEMTKAWYRCAYAAFRVLQLEKSIKIYNKGKGKSGFDYTETQNILNIALHFVNIIIEDKSEFKAGLRQYAAEKWQFAQLPHFIKAQHIFMRSLYLLGTMIFKEWWVHFEKIMDREVKGSADVEKTRRIIISLGILLRRIVLKNFKSHGIHARNVKFFIRINGRNQSDYLDLQKSRFGYDAIDAPQNENLSHLISKLKADAKNYYDLSMATSQDAATPAAPFRDFSDLNLGLKFSKDPKSFNATEKQALYKDFGRVLRHLFQNAIEPGKICVMQDRLRDLLENLQVPGTQLSKKLISDFVDAYFEYTKALVQINNFVYYARVYEFIQETVRIDFLESTQNLRKQITTDLREPTGPLHAALAGERKKNLEAIELLIHDLNYEEEFNTPPILPLDVVMTSSPASSPARPPAPSTLPPPASSSAPSTLPPPASSPVPSPLPPPASSSLPPPGRPPSSVEEVRRLVAAGQPSGIFIDRKDNLSYQSCLCSTCGHYKLFTGRVNPVTKTPIPLERDQTTGTLKFGQTCEKGHLLWRGG